jgi:hypothetical protein
VLLEVILVLELLIVLHAMDNKKIDTLLYDLEMLLKVSEKIENFDNINLDSLNESLNFIKKDILSKYAPISSSQTYK